MLKCPRVLQLYIGALDMAYSKDIIGRAIALSTSKPIKEVIIILQREFETHKIPAEKTVYRWKKIYPHLWQPEIRVIKVEQLDVKRIEEHFEQLAYVAEKFLSGGLITTELSDKTTDVEYIIHDVRDDDKYYTASKEGLVEILKERIEMLDKSPIKWDFNTCLFPHLIPEFTELSPSTFLELISLKPYEVIEQLRLIIKRKTAKGLCPVCENLISKAT